MIARIGVQIKTVFQIISHIYYGLLARRDFIGDFRRTAAISPLHANDAGRDKIVGIVVGILAHNASTNQRGNSSTLFANCQPAPCSYSPKKIISEPLLSNAYARDRYGSAAFN